MNRAIINANLPASPPSVSNSDGVFEDSDSSGLGYRLTKREHFAGLAMQGMSSHPEFYGLSTDFAENIARDCVAFADALLNELAK